MANDKIKVVGYAKKVVYTDGIEYRNFTPDLVGFQLASEGNTPLFTMGNFAITTNMDPRLTKFFTTSNFSNFVTLTDLNISLQQANVLLNDNANPILNLDKSKLDYYALFGSLRELMRVSLENIIIKWPASLSLNFLSANQIGTPFTGNTVQDYVYDEINETSTFKIDTTFINNKFGIVYTSNGSLLNTFSASNDLRNFTINYNSYVINFNNEEYEILNYTASTNTTNDFAYFKVKGSPFPVSASNYTFNYHIKPKKIIVDTFFNQLPDLEYYLLSRDVTPTYTAIFTYPIKSDVGVIVYVTENFTWPVSDGYNIDFDTSNYFDYATRLLNLCDSNDLISSNLMNRFLVSESITSFDTTPVRLPSDYVDDTGQKINKTLQIYGKSYDDINKYILGVSFANTVSYDKKDNTPDIYVKNLANVLGWELVSAVFDNNLLSNYVSSSQSTYSGETVGLTPVEADIELWRRLILNSPWLWKSKGTRKSIEFLLRFIGAPRGLIQFNEYVYKANAPIDIELFKAILLLNGLDTSDLSIYPFDSNGYPRPLADTSDLYFQNFGLWYRETGGLNASIDILAGNNPHVGPYDGGSTYLNQFTCLLPNFEPVVLSSVTVTTDTVNLYDNYDFGAFENSVTTATTVNTVDITNANGTAIEDCVVFIPSIISDPNPTIKLNECGCDTGEPDYALSLCLEKNPNPVVDLNPCKDLYNKPIKNQETGFYTFNTYQYAADGSVLTGSNGIEIVYSSQFSSVECCSSIGGTPFPYDVISNGIIVNKGFICCSNNRCGCTIACKWMVKTNFALLPVPAQNGQQGKYLIFSDEIGNNHIVSPDGCNCIPNLTVPVPNILDPYTNVVGVACQLTEIGLSDLVNNGSGGQIFQYYKNRVNGKISCYS